MVGIGLGFGQQKTNYYNSNPNLGLYYVNYHRHSGRNFAKNAYKFINCLEQVLICLLNLKNYTENFLIFFQNRDVLEEKGGVVSEDVVFFEKTAEDLVYLKSSLERLEEVFLMIRDCSLKKSFLEERFGLSVFKEMLRERFFHGKINEELLKVNNIISLFEFEVSKSFSVEKLITSFFLNFKEKWEEVNNLWNEILQTGCLENEKCFFKTRTILLGIFWTTARIIVSIFFLLLLLIILGVGFYVIFVRDNNLSVNERLYDGLMLSFWVFFCFLLFFICWLLLDPTK